MMKKLLLWLALMAMVSMPVSATYEENYSQMPLGLQMPGELNSTGTHFELINSEYLNITLDSSEPVHLVIESIPEMVMMQLEATSSASSTTISMSGFLPSTTYYKYEDDYLNLVTFTTDSGGIFTYTQDISQEHLVFIQPRTSTKFIRYDTTGGNCTEIGMWDYTTKTCTLTTDVFESIQIGDNGITLDGNGHTVTGTGTGYGVNIWPYSDITIKNLFVKGFSYGIYAATSSSTLNDNTISDNEYGIYSGGPGNTLTGNIVTMNNKCGIKIQGGPGNILTSNTASNNVIGIYLEGSYGSTLTYNTMSGNKWNFVLWGVSDSTFDHSIDTSNIVDGKSIYYVKNAQNQIYDSSTTPTPGTIYLINCDNIQIRDLALTENGYGILLWKTSNSKIENVVVSGLYAGIALLYSNGNTLTTSTISNNYFSYSACWDSGIYLQNSNDNTISSNTISKNCYGIYGSGNDRNILIDNTISNDVFGINFDASNTNTISDNNLNLGWATGISLWGSTGNTLTSNIVSNSQIYTISLAVSSNGNTLTGNIVSHSWTGIIIAESNSNTLTGNTASGCAIGLHIRGSSGTTLTGNTASNNDLNGIHLEGSSGNTLTGNTASNNHPNGIRLQGSSGNTLSDNCVRSNDVNGIYLDGSENNQIFHNKFVNNPTQAYASGSSSTVFNLDEPVGGNFWSDWTTPDDDQDGFVDIPYVFAGGQDNLPLTTQTGCYLYTPPTVTVSEAVVTINEGSQALNTGTYSDLDSADNIVITASIGTIIKTGTSSGTWSWSFTPADGPQTQTVTITADDGKGGVTITTFSLAVNNVAPIITSITGPSEPLPLGSLAGVTLEFADPGTMDTHTCYFSWGDGSSSPGTVTEYEGSGSCSGTHTYAAVGVYLGEVTVTDKDGGSITDQLEFVVVYDPNAGFVTGGGWIDSPAGAYTDDPTLSGKATFGFVSKYQKGAIVPIGTTEFQFHMATFNFHSTDYQWLVVSGPKAQYKGTGIVNGAGSYGFLLTATDGQLPGGSGVDKFRIKIWDMMADDAIVYDNVLGASDDMEEANPQDISGGSIVIHK